MPAGEAVVGAGGFLPVELAAAHANNFIDEKWFDVSWKPVWGVLGANLAFVAAVFVMAR